MAMMIGFGLVVGIPITALLLSHQRKMAELIHSNHEERKTDGMHRIQALEDEVRHLRSTVHELILRNDDLQPATLPLTQQQRSGADNEIATH